MDKPAFDAEARELAHEVQRLLLYAVQCSPVGHTQVCERIAGPIAAAFQRIHASRQPEIDAALVPDAFIETLENAADQPARLTPYQIASLLLGAASRLRRPPPPPAPQAREALIQRLLAWSKHWRGVDIADVQADLAAAAASLRAIPASGVDGPTQDQMQIAANLIKATIDAVERWLHVLAAAPPPGGRADPAKPDPSAT